jgi:hypothetical protein
MNLFTYWNFNGYGFPIGIEHTYPLFGRKVIYLGVGRRCAGVTVLAFARHSLQVTTVSKSLHGIFGQTLGFPPFHDDGPYIRPERAPKTFLRIHK